MSKEVGQWQSDALPGQNDEDDGEAGEPRGQGEPSTSGRLNGAAPVSNGELICPILKLAERELQNTK